MAGFSAISSLNNRPSILSTLRQQSNEESNFYCTNDGYGQTLVLYQSKVFITLDGNTFTEHSFNNDGNGNQDFSSAHINSSVASLRAKQSSPSPAPVITNPTLYPASSNAGVKNKFKCVNCERNSPCTPKDCCESCNQLMLEHRLCELNEKEVVRIGELRLEDRISELSLLLPPAEGFPKLKLNKSKKDTIGDATTSTRRKTVKYTLASTTKCSRVNKSEKEYG